MPFKRARVLREPPSEVLDFQGVARGGLLTSVLGGLEWVGKGIFGGSFFGVSVGNRGFTNLTCLNDISQGGGRQALNDEISVGLVALAGAAQQDGLARAGGAQRLDAQVVDLFVEDRAKQSRDLDDGAVFESVAAGQKL